MAEPQNLQQPPRWGAPPAESWGHSQAAPSLGVFCHRAAGEGVGRGVGSQALASR